ncbi:MAG: hypothetical protein KKD92_02335 [Proteobacteria bacterium]|nr:hypothetical protein [Pseudomonadota bacterium]
MSNKFVIKVSDSIAGFSKDALSADTHDCTGKKRAINASESKKDSIPYRNKRFACQNAGYKDGFSPDLEEKFFLTTECHIGVSQAITSHTVLHHAFLKSSKWVHREALWPYLQELERTLFYHPDKLEKNLYLRLPVIDSNIQEIIRFDSV